MPPLYFERPDLCTDQVIPRGLAAKAATQAQLDALVVRLTPAEAAQHVAEDGGAPGQDVTPLEVRTAIPIFEWTVVPPPDPGWAARPRKAVTKPILGG